MKGSFSFSGKSAVVHRGDPTDGFNGWLVGWLFECKSF